MAWVNGVFAVACLAVALLHLARLARRRRDVPLEGAYAAMACGMAGMFSPVGDPVPAGVWAALFLLCAGWFGGLMLHDRSVCALRGEAMHLVVGSAAMLFMLGADHEVSGGDGRHAAHAAEAPGLAGIASAVALGFAAYFVLHTLRCMDRLGADRLSPGRGRAAAPGIRVSGGALAVQARLTWSFAFPGPALAHLVMTVAMAVMLIGMI